MLDCGICNVAGDNVPAMSWHFARTLGEAGRREQERNDRVPLRLLQRRLHALRRERHAPQADAGGVEDRITDCGWHEA